MNIQKTYSWCFPQSVTQSSFHGGHGAFLRMWRKWIRLVRDMHKVMTQVCIYGNTLWDWCQSVITECWHAMKRNLASGSNLSTDVLNLALSPYESRCHRDLINGSQLERKRWVALSKCQDFQLILSVVRSHVWRHALLAHQQRGKKRKTHIVPFESFMMVHWQLVCVWLGFAFQCPY